MGKDKHIIEFKKYFCSGCHEEYTELSGPEELEINFRCEMSKPRLLISLLIIIKNYNNGK